jgi:UDP:flavonoid glycosyltransferase YjiC (YdhE family)
MATIVFFSQPYYGHTHPTLPVVTELVRRGVRVIYYSLEDFQATIEQTGAEFRSYDKAFPFEHEAAYENQFILYVRFLKVSQLVLEHLLPDIRADARMRLCTTSFVSGGLLSLNCLMSLRLVT